MIDKFILYNSEVGSRLVFDRDSSDYLIDDDGLDWGEITNVLTGVNTLDGYGTDLTSMYIADPRTISVVGWVVGSELEMLQKKSNLSQALAPRSNIRIEIPKSISEDYHIDAVVSKTLQFSPEYKYNNEKMCKFTFSLEAPFPFFQLEKEYSQQDLDDLNYIVYNEGDIPVGVEVALRVDSSVTDPYIQFSTDYGKTSRLLWTGTYSSPLSFEINTKYGLKDFKIGGIRSFQPLDFENSDWIMLPVAKKSSQGIDISIPTGMHIHKLIYTESYSSLGGL